MADWMAYVWEAEEDPSLRAAVWGHCNSLFVEQRVAAVQVTPRMPLPPLPVAPLCALVPLMHHESLASIWGFTLGFHLRAQPWFPSQGWPQVSI